MMTHRWGHVLSGLGHALVLALAGFMLMGSLAVIGAHTGGDAVAVGLAEVIASETVTETPADRAARELRDTRGSHSAALPETEGTMR